MGKIVKIIEPKIVIDVVYFKYVKVEYDGVEYVFNSEEGDNGTTYYCSIDGGHSVMMNYEFDNDIAKELCEKVFTAYNEGIIEEDVVTEFDIDNVNL
jgi:hypothetical protein